MLKIGGYLVVAVPHKFLFERKQFPPSRWNADHKQFYTPGSLMREVEESLQPNSYRLRLLEDNDWGNQLSLKEPSLMPGGGGYEIVMVIEKVAKPNWELLP